MGRQIQGSMTTPTKKKSGRQAGLYLCLYGMNFPEEAGLGVCLVF